VSPQAGKTAFRNHENKLAGGYFERFSIGTVENQPHLASPLKKHEPAQRFPKGAKRLGRKMGNWLTRNEAQELANAASKTNLRRWRDGAMVGLLLGCGLRRSEVVGLNLDRLQSREGHWVTVNLIGKGARIRTVPVPW
jgi:site-specific recombinase XerC